MPSNTSLVVSIGLLVPLAMPSAQQFNSPGISTPVSDLPGLVSMGGPDVRVWQPMSGDFIGPTFSESDTNPNPFLDYRLNVRFISPTGKEHNVPGFFDGDGNGGGTGNLWRVRFTPDEEGAWLFIASFRTGTNIAASLSPNAGTPTSFDGAVGVFDVFAVDPFAPGFLSKGFLQYVDGHYLRFQNGEYFLKGGTDSPENLLAYWGIDDVSNDGGFGIVHCFDAHVEDWEVGDPYFETNSDECGTAEGSDNSKGLIGLLNYLSEQHVNSIYFLPMNLGGDAWDTSPFIDQSGTPYGNTHYDISRLTQWNTVFEHAMRKGLMLHFVLQETEDANEDWLDGGVLGVERRLFYREMVARFGHHPAIKWMHGEEWDQLSSGSITDLEARVAYMNALDPYDHYNAVHNRTPFDDLAEHILGNPDIQGTSIQYGTEAGVGQDEAPGAFVEKWRAASTAAGVPWVVDMDENNPLEANETTVDLLRMQVTYPVYLSGGNIEWYYEAASGPAPDVFMDDLLMLEPLFEQTWFARNLIETHLEFWNMAPSDELLVGESQLFEGGQVLALPGQQYGVYLPRASSTGSLDLPAGQYMLDWYNPRLMKGGYGTQVLNGGGPTPLGPVPGTSGQDWFAIVQRNDGVVLGSPKPGVFGMANQVAIHAQPGAPLLLFFGAPAEGVPLPLCSGLTLDIWEPVALDTLVADANGESSWSPYVPANMPPGTTIVIQVWDFANCVVSNPISLNWP